MADDRMKNDDLQQRDMGSTSREGQDFGKQTPGRQGDQQGGGQHAGGKQGGQGGGGQHKEPRKMEEDDELGGGAGQTGDQNRGGQNRGGQNR